VIDTARRKRVFPCGDEEQVFPVVHSAFLSKKREELLRIVDQAYHAVLHSYLVRSRRKRKKGESREVRAEYRR